MHNNSPPGEGSAGPPPLLPRDTELRVRPCCVSACDVGRWGPGCAHTCNCSNSDGSCSAETGQCLCDAGYTGGRCEERECCGAAPLTFNPLRGH